MMLNVPVVVDAPWPVPVVAVKVAFNDVVEDRVKVPVIEPVAPDEFVSVPLQLPPVLKVPVADALFPMLAESVFVTLTLRVPLVEMDTVTSPEPFGTPFSAEEKVPE